MVDGKEESDQNRADFQSSHDLVSEIEAAWDTGARTSSISLQTTMVASRDSSKTLNSQHAVLNQQQSSFLSSRTSVEGASLQSEAEMSLRLNQLPSFLFCPSLGQGHVLGEYSIDLRISVSVIRDLTQKKLLLKSRSAGGSRSHIRPPALSPSLSL